MGPQTGLSPLSWSPTSRSWLYWKYGFSQDSLSLSLAILALSDKVVYLRGSEMSASWRVLQLPFRPTGQVLFETTMTRIPSPVSYGRRSS